MVDSIGTAAAARRPKTTVSFEFFPPRSGKAVETLDAVVARLAKLGPAFMTVTYGAGGSTTDPTLEAVLKIQRLHGIPTASHLTFVSTPIWEVASYAARLKDEGIGHVVALRGDPPAGRPRDHYGGAGFFHSTPAFIASLKRMWGFEISVAAYPEKHPDTLSAEGDIAMLARKADAGADRAITQFFFENATYFRFLDEAEIEGIDMPIVPGVLPVLDFEKMLGFAARCGASVPAWLAARFSRFESLEDRRKVAEDILIAQVADLIARGVPHIHIFTLNEAGMSERVCTTLRIGGSTQAAA